MRFCLIRLIKPSPKSPRNANEKNSLSGIKYIVITPDIIPKNTMAVFNALVEVGVRVGQMELG